MTNYNQLNWITSSEKNNEKFDIERSANGIDYAKIGEVKGSGNSIIQRKYRFDDLKLDDAPIHYYRLKQVDFDGQFEYSKIIAISQKTLDQISSVSKSGEIDDSPRFEWDEWISIQIV
ncbi:MAG: hypothetical protein IPK03_09595 [Bacteroidetes bacterium]|nr:hypothetical protein [Bacteroidota bacterium]